MEVIEMALGEFARRRRSVSVPHRHTGLTRGLEYGERVLVLARGEYRNAAVASIDFDLEDTYYHLVLGGLVPAEVAEARIAGVLETPTAVGPATVHDVVDMLGVALALSGSAGSPTAQRGRRLARH